MSFYDLTHAERDAESEHPHRVLGMSNQTMPALIAMYYRNLNSDAFASHAIAWAARREILSRRRPDSAEILLLA